MKMRGFLMAEIPLYGFQLPVGRACLRGQA